MLGLMRPRWDGVDSGSASLKYVKHAIEHGTWFMQIERDETLRPFQSYTNRFRHSYEASYSTNPLYYSTNIGRKDFSSLLTQLLSYHMHAK